MSRGVCAIYRNYKHDLTLIYLRVGEIELFFGRDILIIARECEGGGARQREKRTLKIHSFRIFRLFTKKKPSSVELLCRGMKKKIRNGLPSGKN